MLTANFSAIKIKKNTKNYGFSIEKGYKSEINC